MAGMWLEGVGSSSDMSLVTSGASTDVSLASAVCPTAFVVDTWGVVAMAMGMSNSPRRSALRKDSGS